MGSTISYGYATKSKDNEEDTSSMTILSNK